MIFKTDWNEKDFINVTDINRIVSNIYYIYELAKIPFGAFIVANMQYYSSFNQSPDILMYRNIEDNVALINKKTYNFEYQEKVFNDFSVTNLYIKSWDYNDLNRIEDMIQRLYKALPKIYSENLLTEDGINLTTEDGEDLFTEGE